MKNMTVIVSITIMVLSICVLPFSSIGAKILPASTESILPNVQARQEIFNGCFFPSQITVASGEIFDATFSICPTVDSPTTTISIVMPADLVRLVKGDSTWAGDVAKGERVRLAFSMVADAGVDVSVVANVGGFLHGKPCSSSYGFRVTTPAKNESSNLSSNNYVPNRLYGPHVESTPSSPGTITITGWVHYLDDRNWEVPGGK